MLDNFNIPYEARVISAHRSLEELIEYTASFEEAGIEVCIALAGMAAALPGVIAGSTTIPVIGVPLSSNGLGGVDALYSTLQMPSGVPVATVAIDGCANAAVLAAQILSLAHPELKQDLKAYKKQMNEKVHAQDLELKEGLK